MSDKMYATLKKQKQKCHLMYLLFTGGIDQNSKKMSSFEVCIIPGHF